MMAQADRALANIDSLRALGLTLATDDFGTGYSSISHLKRFAVNKLKTDQSFVRDIPEDANDQAKAVIALGHSLQLRVIAEGVEREAQKAFLKSEGCDKCKASYAAFPFRAKSLPICCINCSGASGGSGERVSSPPSHSQINRIRWFLAQLSFEASPSPP